MGMGHTTLTVDEDLIEKAKEKGINISKLLREALQKALDAGKDMTEQCNEAIAILKNARQECNDGILLLEQRLLEVSQDVELRKQKLTDKCKDIPEIQNLPKYYLVDTKKMMALINVLRDKYPNLRISIAEIREYNQL